MKLKLPILDLSKDYKNVEIEVAANRQLSKFAEEEWEYKQEDVGSDKACDEWFDMVQVLLHLGKLEFTPEQIQQGAQRHYAKLQGRDRKIIGSINISVEVEG